MSISLVNNHFDKSIMKPTSTAIPYRDHHKIIKAIEKCSLRATFGSEITSTKELLANKGGLSSGINPKASHKSGSDAVKKPARFRIPPFFKSKPRVKEGVLPINPTNEAGTIPSDLAINDGNITVISHNQHGLKLLNRITNDGNSPSKRTTNDGDMPAVLVNNNSRVPSQQTDFFGWIPPELRTEKVNYPAFTSLIIDFANTFALLD